MTVNPIPPAANLLCFAYGSNMDPWQMSQRCPSAQAIGVAELNGYALCFPRYSKRRKGGVASIRQQSGSVVWGVVYSLSVADCDVLDRHEGYQRDRPATENSYNRVQISVVLAGTATDVQVYVAESQAIDPLPTAAYLQHLQDGARHHGLPAYYVDYLARLEHI